IIISVATGLAPALFWKPACAACATCLLTRVGSRSTVFVSPRASGRQRCKEKRIPAALDFRKYKWRKVQVGNNLMAEPFARGGLKSRCLLMTKLLKHFGQESRFSRHCRPVSGHIIEQALLNEQTISQHE